jgi:hypothetical protein
MQPGAFVKGEKRPGQGRPKGSLSKNTIAAKEMISMAADKLGGLDRMVAWVQEDAKNEQIFWGSIYPKLIPTQVTGENGGPVGVALTIVGIANAPAKG